MPSVVTSVVGARPQFIKAAVVVAALERHEAVASRLVHTGQHYDEGMSAVFFDQLGIPAPDHHLGVGAGSHGRQTGRMLERIEEVLLDTRPDWVLVFGDTNSTLAGALAAAKLHVPVAHVEAGLRSFNRRMPEETNRVVTDHVADVLFAPTAVAVEHLRREGVPDSRIEQVGDVMYDCALHFGELAAAHSDVLDRLGLAGRDYALATVHRAENTDDPDRLRAVVGALETLAERMPVVWPVHPRTAAALDGLGAEPGRRVVTIPPASYLDMVMLERAARLIATDSGGVQKEAFFHGVPCVTLRDETEWTELIELGWNRLASPAGGAERVAEVLDAALAAGPGRPGQPYGDGKAAERIAARLAGGL